MKLMKYIIPILGLIVLSLSACTEKVDLKLNAEDPVVAIEGYVCTELDSSFVRVTFSAPFNNPEKIAPISNAVVEIGPEGGPMEIWTHAGNGVYRPVPGYKADTGKVYNLKVTYEGKTYTSRATLFPMFFVADTLSQIFRPADGFIEEGWAIIYWSIDTRPGNEIIQTQFNWGVNDTFETTTVFFANSQIRLNEFLPFELPFFRPLSGDSVMLVFRSLDNTAAQYFISLENLRQPPPGPFATPPANPPTNITGGAVGGFRASDVVRRWRIVD